MDNVKHPSHYTSYRFEVCDIIAYILNTYYHDAEPYECYTIGNEIKYRLRAGLKDDGHNGAQDIAKAMQYRHMRGD